MRRAEKLAVAVLVVTALGLAGGSQADPAHDLGGNPVTSVGNGIEAYDGSRLAQSFVLASNVLLDRISLRLVDVGASGLSTLAIIEGTSSAPSLLVIASRPVAASSSSAWVDILWDPSVYLRGGITYWIVLSDSRSPGGGTEWWNTGYDANATGKGMVQVAGWTDLPGDFTFHLYGRREVAVALELGSPTDIAPPNRTVNVSLSVSTRSEHPLGCMWLNLTLPPEFAFVGDDLDTSILAFARFANGSAVGYEIQNVSTGTRAFNVTLSVNGSATVGKSTSVAASLEYPTVNGSVSRISKTLTFLVLDVAALVDIGSTEERVVPGRTIHYWVNATNPTGGRTLRDLRVDLTVLANAAFSSASPGGTFSDTRVSWIPMDLAANSARRCSSEATLPYPLEPSDVARVRYAVTFVENGSLLRLEEGILTTRAAVPRLSLELETATGLVRDDEALQFTIRLRNSGTHPARNVWFNDSIDERLSFLGDNRSGGDLFASPDLLSWHFPEIPEGEDMIEIRMRARDLLFDGARIGSLVSADYRDGADRPESRVFSNIVVIEAVAPRIGLDVRILATEIEPGVVLRETITLRNDGRDVSKIVTISQTLGPNLRYVGSDSFTTPSLVDGVLSWTYRDVGPGDVISYHVDLQATNADPQSALVGLSATALFSDADGTSTATVLSDIASLRIAPLPPLLSLSNPWFLILIAVAAAGVGIGGASFLRGNAVIEDALLVRKDGILISHRYPRNALTRDADTFSAMFTAIQDFVRDSFEYREGRVLRNLNFGDLSGAIVSGEEIYLAVIYGGRPGLRFRSRLEGLLRRIEAEQGAFLASWDGDRLATAHIDRLIDPLVSHSSEATRHADEIAEVASHMLSESEEP